VEVKKAGRGLMTKFWMVGQSYTSDKLGGRGETLHKVQEEVLEEYLDRKATG